MEYHARYSVPVFDPPRTGISISKRLAEKHTILSQFSHTAAVRTLYHIVSRLSACSGA